MSASKFIVDLAAVGRYHFTTADFAKATGSSTKATRAALRRLKRKGSVATPYRGFHLGVPPEYRGIECLPADQFIPQLMEHLGLGYYVALLSAARYHGAAHHQPQLFQVMVQKNRPPIECGKVRVVFAARRNLDHIPTVLFHSPRGKVRVSSPEATAFDLVGYPSRAAGLDHVATVLAELSERIDPELLAQVAALSPVPWSQRLGYLLSLVGAAPAASALVDRVARSTPETVALVPGKKSTGASRDPRWKLLVNRKVEPDL